VVEDIAGEAHQEMLPRGTVCDQVLQKEEEKN
jgi:hypothetical protein